MIPIGMGDYVNPARVLAVVGIAALLGAVLAVLSTMTTTVLERRPEIALMKALGAANATRRRGRVSRRPSRPSRVGTPPSRTRRARRPEG